MITVVHQGSQKPLDWGSVEHLGWIINGGVPLQYSYIVNDGTITLYTARGRPVEATREQYDAINGFYSERARLASAEPSRGEEADDHPRDAGAMADGDV